MAHYIADLHIHSKYSRATSRDMDIENITRWAGIKGISLMGTGDFTHPQWLAELKGALEPKDNGLFRHAEVDFVLTAEVSNIYFKAGRTRKVHNIIFAPDFKAADEINAFLGGYGRLESDGRPMLGLPCDKMAKKIFNIDPRSMIVPAHAWTPHFSVFGSNSGFDEIEECFEGQTENIYAIETGLSSDPAMNWRWSKLDSFTLMSNSDAHSPSKLGREANVLSAPVDYDGLRDVLKNKDKSRFLYTIEFFPEEGKYHWDGHRMCSQRLSPGEAKNLNYRCPVCGKKVTVGVLNRVESLSDRKEGFIVESSPAYKCLIPLAEVIGAALDVGPDTVTARKEYDKLIKAFGTEFNVLLDAPEPELAKQAPAKVAKGIAKVREGKVEVVPGYDGVYGKVNIFGSEDEEERKQLTFF